MKLKIFLVVLILASVFCISSTASAMTEMERQTLITQLKQQMLQLIQQIVPMIIEKIEQIVVQEQANPSWCHTFYSNIGYNQSGTAENVYLHIALAKQGISYSPDNFYTYSPNGTLQAVIQFQAMYGIYPQSGYVGPVTRAKLNQLYGCGIVTGCSPNWSCGSWSTCYSGQHTRTCTDYNYCGITAGKPAITESCGTTCTPNWQLGTWGTCASGQQTRIVTDSNNCGITVGKPLTTQSCTVTCSPNWQLGTWGTCYSGNHTRTVTDLNHCGVTADKPSTTESCTVTCTSFNYSSWSPSVCPPSGAQTRTVSSSSPSGCVDGTPITTQTCIPQPSIDIKAENSDGPLDIYLQAGNGATANPSGGITLTKNINLAWTGFEVNACSAASTPTLLFDGFKTTSGSQTVTLSGNIPGTSINDKVSGVFTMNCRASDSSIKTNSVTVNLYYNISGPCDPDWQCTSWGACTNGHHTRTCSDSNLCGTARPANLLLSESCTLQLTTINLTPASASLYTLTGGNNINTTQQLTATTLDQDGNQISANLTWNSSDRIRATVNSSGLVASSYSLGTATITASSGSVVSNSVLITLQPAPPTSIIVTPASTNLAVNGTHTQQLTARDQNQRDITNEVNWSSNNNSKATVSSSGLVTAVGTGAATITASSTYNPNVKGTATITVFAAGPTVTMSADTTYIQGIDGHAYLTWTSSNAISCDIDGSSVALSGTRCVSQAPKTYTIECTDGNLSATSSITLSGNSGSCW